MTLSQALTVGPNTRIEFKRQDDGSYVDVELPRAEYTVLRDRIGLRTGAQVHLLPRRVTRFATDEMPDRRDDLTGRPDPPHLTAAQSERPCPAAAFSARSTTARVSGGANVSMNS